MTDYFDTEFVPFVFDQKSDDGSNPEQDTKARQEFFEFLKSCVCKCVIADPANGLPAIVDKPEGQCESHEISFVDTLADDDAVLIYTEIDSLSKGGISQDNLATFRQEQDLPKDDNGDVGEVQQITA